MKINKRIIVSLSACLSLFFAMSALAAEKRVIGMIVKEPTAPYIQAFVRAAEQA